MLLSIFFSQLLGFGLSVISDIDPNPDNFVSAGIVNTTSVLVGCLVRLEPNKQTKVRIVCVCVGLDPSSVKSQYSRKFCGCKFLAPEPSVEMFVGSNN